jgi:hypothetical protein
MAAPLLAGLRIPSAVAPIRFSEARGQNREAADCYRKVIEFVRDHPDQYDPEFNNTFHRLVAKLDPQPAD